MTRTLLPPRRRHQTEKLRIGGVAFHMGHAPYPDAEGNSTGRPAEVFLDCHKAGSTLKGVMHSLAVMISLALQHGVPLCAIVDALKEMDFPPQGPVQGSPEITESTSIANLVVRQLEALYPNPPPPPATPVEQLRAENEKLRRENAILAEAVNQWETKNAEDPRGERGSDRVPKDVQGGSSNGADLA